MYTLVYTTYIWIAAAFVPQEERPRFRAWHQRRGCAGMCRILRLRVHVAGSVPAGGPFLIVCNHFGVIDPLVLASQLDIAFVGMAELRRWPFVGWVTRQVGLIFVIRERTGPIVAFLEAVRRRLDDGVSVLVFAEGSTSDDDSVRPFKTGAFASVEGRSTARVLPAYVRPLRVNGRPAVGSMRSLVIWSGGRQSFLAHIFQLLRLDNVDIALQLGSPIPVGELDRKELAGRTHEEVAALQQSAFGT